MHIISAGSTTFGIIGLVPKRGEGITEPLAAARNAAKELRKRNVDVIVVLSSLGL